MLAELRERVEAYLASHRGCVLCAEGAEGACAMPARYRAQGLALDCLLPRWADLAFYLERPVGGPTGGQPLVTVLILDPDTGGRRWLQCRGIARPVPAVSATTAIRAHHRFGQIRSGGPSIRVVETTKNWECSDRGRNACRMIPVLL